MLTIEQVVGRTPVVDLDFKDRFHLPFVVTHDLKQLPEDFGFGLLGQAVFYRTYSRTTLDGRQERWADTVIRVVEGIMTVRKWWYHSNNIFWDTQHWNKIATEMAYAIYHMHMLPPGRGLWAAGSDWMYERGSAALYNCAYTEVRHLSTDAAWTMDLLMCGVGVGHSTQFLGSPQFYRPDESIPFIFSIPDSREGWVESLKLLIESYEKPNMRGVRFDYSEIRKEGEPIRGFGGTASGPKPLEMLHDRVRGYLDRYVSGETSSVRLTVDIMNAIGACVVAGNVRRSAEISLGDPTNDEFINLKNYEVNPDRADIGWMSNNSVVIDEYNDLNALPALANRIRDNGEPGIFNLMNIQKYGRYGEKKPDRATGANPCAEIPLEDGEVCNLVEVFPTRCVDEYGKFSPTIYYRALELATIYASTVSLLPTHSEKTNAVVERNRRIGVSLSGIADWMTQQHATDVIRWLDRGYQAVRYTNLRYNEEAGVPESVRVTTVKPSGTISLLAGVSSGMHLPPFSRYLRRVRIGKSAPIVPILMDAGVPYEEDVYDKTKSTWVFEFPVDQGKVKGQKDVSVWEKAQTVIMLQKFWADNMVSNTLSFDPKREGPQIEGLLTFTTPFIKTISLMPLLDEGAVYEQSPIEQITLEEAKNRAEGIRMIDWSQFGGSDGEDSKFCNNDTCEI